MSSIVINDLNFSDAYLNELRNEEMNMIVGGLEFTIGKKWKRPIHVSIKIKIG